MSCMLFQFANEKFVQIDWCDPYELETLVADSFLVDEGKIIALEKHLQRFRNSVENFTEVDTQKLDNFEQTLPSMLPREGSWFPRIEAVKTKNGTALRYRQRPTPKVGAGGGEIVVSRAPRDPRKSPSIKGPDLAELMRLRRDVAKLGADEAIITTGQDLLVEGAYSSLAVWLAGSNELTMIPDHTVHLPGVTEAVIQELAEMQGVSVKKMDLFVSDLKDAEVWILSSLHGVRVAQTFIDGPQLNIVNGRRELWQNLWKSCAETPPTNLSGLRESRIDFEA